jgi:hypothetical protein
MVSLEVWQSMQSIPAAKWTSGAMWVRLRAPEVITGPGRPFRVGTMELFPS